MNRIVIHCGNGRGKTSSAAGVVCRALAHGQKVLAAQFFKPEPDSGLRLLQKTAPDLLTLRNYGSWYFLDDPDEKAYEVYSRALEDIIDLIRRNGFKLILLDEILYTVQFGILDAQKIIDLMELFDNKCFILTGRNAAPELLNKADTISNIECVKHAFDEGINAQCGVEF